MDIGKVSFLVAMKWCMHRVWDLGEAMLDLFGLLLQDGRGKRVDLNILDWRSMGEDMDEDLEDLKQLEHLEEEDAPGTSQEQEKSVVVERESPKRCAWG